ncbi:MAG: hypothetical protein OWU84_03825 [Firmicutes bacterium]|nr:hypothetical protein [Bacillota bacterium]
MGLFDALFGRTKLPAGKTDALFALSTAALDIETRLNSSYGGKAAIVLRAVDNSEYDAISKDVHDLLNLGGGDFRATVSMHQDDMGFQWIILEGPDLEDAINGLHMTADLIKQAGFADSLLAAMFRFGDWYLIYSYRRATFYPFVPTGRSSRQESREFRIRQTLANALPMEKDPERWYPLWDPPI